MYMLKIQLVQRRNRVSRLTSPRKLESRRRMWVIPSR